MRTTSSTPSRPPAIHADSKRPASKPGSTSGKNRRFLMFLLGADEAELRQCLAKKKMLLTTAGAKADNVPVKAEDQAKFVSMLHGAPMRHVRDWFCEHGSFEDLPEASRACETLASETEAAKLDETECRKHWRSILAAFVQHTRAPEVDDFLKGSAPYPLAALLPEAKEAPIALEAAAKPAPPPAAKAERRPVLITDAPAQPRVAATAPAVPLSLGDVELEDKTTLTVIGRRTKELANGQFFIHIEGIISGEDVIRLSPEEAREVFPETGDATAFPGTVPLPPSAADRLSVWRVEHKSPDKPTQFVITEFISHVYDVFDLPHTSAEPDLVRAWIREYYKPTPNVIPVFQLADGPIVKLSYDTTEPGAADFDSPLNGYRQHPSMKWLGRRIILKKFPPPDFKYDCAPIRTVARRLFRAKLDLAGIPALTKAQASELADAVAQYSDAGLAQAAQRVKPQLAQLFASEELLDGLMDDILQLPPVQAAVDREKARLAERMREEAAASNAELGKLAAEKKQLQDEIAALKQSRKKEAANVAREIKLAFEQAGKEGLKTLANVSLLKAVLNLDGAGQALPPVAPATVAEPAPAEHAAPQPELAQAAIQAASCPAISDPKALASILARWYLYSGLSTRMLQASIAGAAASGILGLAGSRREETAAALASTLAGGTVCTVSVTGDMFGLPDLMNAPGTVAHPGGTLAMPLGDFISQRQAAGQLAVIRLRGVNRIPPESLIPELLEATDRSRPAAISWTGKKGEIRLATFTTPAVFLLDFAQGRSVFPFALPIAAQLPLIDTDAPWGDEDEPVAGTSAPAAVLDPAFFSQLASGVDAAAPLASGSVPRGAAASAGRMKAALGAIGMDKGARPDLFPVLAYGLGRRDSSKLAETVTALGGELAEALKAYVATADFNYLFDIGADA